MTVADSNRGRLAYLPEVTFGTALVTPTLQILRPTSTDFGVQKQTVSSNEVRADRMTSAIMDTEYTVTGGFGFELSLGGTLNDFFAAAVGGATSPVNTVSGSIIASSVANTYGFTGIGSSFATGQYVYFTGFTNAANNGWHRITVTTANLITVAETLVTETTTATVKGRCFRTDSIPRSFFFEESFTDIAQFTGYGAMRLGSLSIDASAGQITTGKVTFQGAKFNAPQSTTFSTGGFLPATTTSPVTASSNFGAIMEGAPTLSNLATGVQAFSINIENTLRNQMAVGSKTPYGVGYGRQIITGTLNAYFENAALYTKYLNHTGTGLAFQVIDSVGNAMRITLPNVYFTQDNPSIGGVDQDVMEQIQWTAIMGTMGAATTQIQIDLNH